METNRCGGRGGGDAGGVWAGKTRSERWNSKSKEELQRRKTNDFNFKKTDELYPTPFLQIYCQGHFHHKSLPSQHFSIGAGNLNYPYKL